MNILYSDLILNVSQEKFMIESTSENRKEALFIDRVTHELEIKAIASQVERLNFTERKSIAGLLGILELPSGLHLLIARGRDKIGEITPENHGVYRMVSAEILAFAKSTNHLSSAQLEANSAYLSMVEQVLSTPEFYFSYSMDLSHSSQRRATLGPNGLIPSVISLHSKCDSRFVWNHWLLKRFLALGEPFLQYCVPILHGVIYIRKCSLNGKYFRWAMIARRSNRRAGVRYFRRGCDEWGQCANFVESEQIVEHCESWSSYVQTRGSIPLFWTQLPNVKDRKPTPKLEAEKKHVDAFKKHFLEQQALYGGQVMLNLVDQHKAEGDLQRHVKSVHETANLANVQYVAFDFHAECPTMNWDKLFNLVRDLSPQLLQQSHFYQTTSGGVLSRQIGVFRTNCIDCLDRTNVVQSLIFRENIQLVLMKMGVLGEGEPIQSFPHFIDIFNNVMADIGDILSIQYAGTGALKTDFTRTGKRTVPGMLNDLKVTVNRYIKNNFFDGFRQDAIDLFLGRHQFNPGAPDAIEPLTTYTPLHALLPVCLILSLGMLLLTAFSGGDWADQGTWIYLGFWLAAICGVLALLRRQAEEYVNKPRLIVV
ncbi:hypothetical protein TCAL_02285 [Tigriopus californicus]|uniref:Phosphatidylinositol-3-phosphatase SAC1 n=1 Tax=Tigriopus californicus TaxID=6832 RepID=A0A553NP58_TIGCA|nr:phosphatidylinositol-3-phosphatase SAC1-like [Tigriopus californicus]TRY67180.1 hypothetical protein TCAL_02285 [Tigriopus californicus]